MHWRTSAAPRSGDSSWMTGPRPCALFPVRRQRERDHGEEVPRGFGATPVKEFGAPVNDERKKTKRSVWGNKEKKNKVKTTQTPHQQQGYHAAKDPLVWGLPRRIHAPAPPSCTGAPPPLPPAGEQIQTATRDAGGWKRPLKREADQPQNRCRSPCVRLSSARVPQPARQDRGAGDLRDAAAVLSLRADRHGRNWR